MSGWLACGFQTELCFADVFGDICMYLPDKPTLATSNYARQILEDLNWNELLSSTKQHDIVYCGDSLVDVLCFISHL